MKAILKYAELVIIACLISSNVFTQDLSYSKPGNNFYYEMANPAKTISEEWTKNSNVVNVSFASDNVRYPKEKVPMLTNRSSWNATSWKGEKVHTQVLVWTKKDIPELSYQIGDLIDDKGNRINSEKIKVAFVRYVMADEFGGGCNDRKSTDYDSSLVADPIDIIDNIPVQKNTVQPIWVSIQVPSDIPSGTYRGKIVIKALQQHDLTISINVSDHVLPPPDQWKFDLDLWQYPAPIARIHDVELWSDEHFKILRPYYTALANAGQKVITANIIDQPWGNTHVYFDDPSLIRWIKKKDGSWEFDYSMFDKYISFVMSCGIKQRINCYTMVTWDLSFSFYDENSGKDISFNATPGSHEYNDYWTTMLTDFTDHLKLKGWFGITAISMDERPLESMQTVIHILRQIDPEWRIALAGDTYHPEIEGDIFDFSIASYLKFEEDVLNRRKKNGMPTTFYTACKERHPGPYTFSPPSENAWLGWHAAAKGYTGYLFWAYNSWVKDPLLDSRFKAWPAGTCYQFYPGPRTSIRFEKLIEGIQDFEKIRIIRENFIKEGNDDKLKELDEVLSSFDIGRLDSIPAADMLFKAKKQLNSY